ncbi:hypothetical protein XarbCFBP8150_21630, partial [Xanthomonas arboricola]
ACRAASSHGVRPSRSRASRLAPAASSALHEAALAGHGDIVEALLAAGANLEARDLLGRTPWLDAARQA